MCKKERKTHSSPITWHRYAKRTIGWFCPFSSRCKDLPGHPLAEGSRVNIGHTVPKCAWCALKEMSGATVTWSQSVKAGTIERWWNQDGKLATTIQDPPRVWKTDARIVVYLFVSVTCLKTCRFTVCFTSLWTCLSISILTSHVTSSRICWYSLTFIHSITHFHTCIYRHKAHMYN